mmetsp:Transcript_23960/g.63379  ORF Transcript_23960/g.63379 Transcript_23960/m.63379 type:complete len:827 (-) Transcript_23960:185-2665(-)
MDLSRSSMIRMLFSSMRMESKSRKPRLVPGSRDSRLATHSKLGTLSLRSTLNSHSKSSRAARSFFPKLRTQKLRPATAIDRMRRLLPKKGSCHIYSLKSFSNPNFSLIKSHCSQAQNAPLYSLDNPHAILISKEHGVVVDPYLGKSLRPHQVQGVTFLYECISGLRNIPGGGTGAILADAMGLGKSLQAISVMWTALKQGPNGVPLAKKAIVVCPASLVANWTNEVKKWLGVQRIKPTAIMSSSPKEAKQSIADFVSTPLSPLLIIGYEMFRRFAKDLGKSQVGLLICDEGHKLKSAQGNKTIEALSSFRCPRRIILTGTPVQNDLDEFFAVCNFTNPGCLGDISTFRTVFSNPIVQSRDKGASTETKRLGLTRAQELKRVTNVFVLRRAATVIQKYLPPKKEISLFCRLDPEQIVEYSKTCKEAFQDLSKGGRNGGAALGSIQRLRKICSHWDGTEEDANSDEDKPQTKAQGQPKKSIDYSRSGKLKALACFLKHLKESNSPSEKLVLISNFTSNLDIFEDILNQLGVGYLRLDGSTAAGLRGNLVERFNYAKSPFQVFLLSSKAGGVGLNLIGANRLILYDPDWNPANDKQAMARVWREGQQRPVFIYRMLGTDTTEEKIFQRQLFKMDLDLSVEKSSSRAGKGMDGKFSVEELRDLFLPPKNIESSTKDMIEAQDESRFDGKFCSSWEEDLEIGDPVFLKALRECPSFSCICVQDTKVESEVEKSESDDGNALDFAKDEDEALEIDARDDEDLEIVAKDLEEDLEIDAEDDEDLEIVTKDDEEKLEIDDNNHDAMEVESNAEPRRRSKRPKLVVNLAEEDSDE